MSRNYTEQDMAELRRTLGAHHKRNVEELVAVYTTQIDTLRKGHARKQDLKDAIEAYARACERVIYVRLGKSGEAVQERTARKEALEKLLDEVVPDDN